MGSLNPKGIRIPLKNGDAMRVKFDIDSLILLEEEFGSLADVFLSLGSKSFGTIRKVLWVAGEWVGDPERAPESLHAVGQMMDPNLARTKEIVDLLVLAMDEALGTADTEDDAGPTSAKAKRKAATPSPTSAPSPAPQDSLADSATP